MNAESDDKEASRKIDMAHIVPISVASRIGVSALTRRAEQGVPVLLMRNGKPVACILPLQAYFDWTDANGEGGTS